MFKQKKPRKNYRKGHKAQRRAQILSYIMLGVKTMAGLAVLVLATGFFIFFHDFVTQCDYFAAEEITIEGAQRLKPQQIFRQAQVRKGDNILSVKLSIVRKRLLAHPWIAEAEIRREIPSQLIIRIKEHTALAIVDLGDMFLINHQGQLFKAWDPADRLDLPVISGLDLSDLKVFGGSEASDPGHFLADAAPFSAVMQVLELGKRQGSILPNHLIQKISVDRHVGLTIYAFDRLKAISLGYSDYPGKYHMLAKLFAHFQRQRTILDFDRIDLNNLQRIVVNPTITDSRAKES